MNIIMKPNTQTSQNYKNLNEFLSKHYKSKNDEYTHSRIPSTKFQTNGGSYCIQKEDLEEFYTLYSNHVFTNENMEHLTERQLTNNGPILIDLDLKYDYSVAERIHTPDHISDMVGLYLDELKLILNFPEDTSFPIYIFEKPNVNRLEDKSFTKDGIHIIIGVQLDHDTQLYLREQILKKIGSVWSDIPIVNKWDTVFDEGISKGSCGWQLYGSRKPGHQAYELTYYFKVISYDFRDGEFGIEQLPTDNIISSDKLVEGLFKLSAQNDTHPCFEFTEKHKSIMEERTKEQPAYVRKHKIKKLVVDTEDDSPIELENITSITILKKEIDKIMKNLPVDKFCIKEAHEYTQILPEKFYEPGSHVFNTQVALALKHTDERLFLSWVMLRSKASDFDYGTIPSLFQRWNKYYKERENGLTIRSIMYWAKENNREEYERVKLETCEYYVNYTIDKPSDFDLATVLYQMYKDKYVCSSIQSKTWYIFRNHRWELDRGQTLRMTISTHMHGIYQKKLNRLIEDGISKEADDNKQEAIKKKIGKIADVMTMLKKTSDKNNIMREASEIFFDSDFDKNIDTNPWLICFKNGIVDLKNKIFRDGVPTDYITKCTNIHYKEYNEDNETSTEIKQFMKDLFPDPSLNQYMWDHLSSVLIGENLNQTFNIYHGRGSNGKSMLTDLMFMTLGEYSGSVPVSLITDKRPGIGATSSEIIQLKGIRYAVMAEPKKGDRINEGIMKQLTGDSTISGRALYHETQTFNIQFHLVVCTNTLFEISSHDDGTWRRIRVCDFKAKFIEPEEDGMYSTEIYPHQLPKNKNLKDNMKKWIETFAGMLVRYAFNNQGKISNCNVVKNRTDRYRMESDYICCFVKEKIRFDNKSPNNVLKIMDVYSEFKIWYELNAPKEKMPKLNEIKEYIIDKYGKANKDGHWDNLIMVRMNDKMNAEDDVDELDAV